MSDSNTNSNDQKIINNPVNSQKVSGNNPLPNLTTQTSQTSSNDKSSLNLSTSKKFCQFIEVEVLKIIKQLLKEGITQKEKIQAMAQLTLNLIKPWMSLEELYRNAAKLDDTYPELSPVVFKVMKEYEEKYEKKALNEVTKMVRAGNYDQAQAMVKKILNYKAIYQ
ncbi:MAG: hypothetical protein QHH09_02660 [Microgenomates group bacterium]|jgi:hypothetical protein|nr:hypothetical protein [Microgenomates group bacterium]